MDSRQSDKIGRLLATPLSRRAAFSSGAGVAAMSMLGASLAYPDQAVASRMTASDGTTEGRAHQVDSHEITIEKVQRAIAQINAIVAEGMGKSDVPGAAVAVVYRDEVLFLEGFGVRKAGQRERIDVDTIFQLASVSKPIASTVVAGLVGDEVVSWDSRLHDLLPSFEMYDPWVTREVTLRDMFAHRSGLPGHAGDLLEDIGFDREAVLYRLRFQKPSSSFRSAYAYTNFGLTAAAVAATSATGLSWEDLSDELLYRPLGMERTSSRFADFAADANRAATHVMLDGAWTAQYVRNADAQSPAGGVSASIRDLATWLRLQLGNGTLDGREIIKAHALGETHRPQFISDPPEDPATERASFYGLGWNVSYDQAGRVVLGHSGAFALGAATTVYLLPAESLGIAVLTNAAPVGVPEAVALSFLDLVTVGAIQHDYFELLRQYMERELAPAYNTDYSDPPEPAAPALPHDSYAGSYANDLFGEISVETQDGRLMLLLGPEPQQFPLQHYDRDVFVYQPVSENAGGLSGVTFTIGADRRATAVVIEDLNIHGQGTFVRQR